MENITSFLIPTSLTEGDSTFYHFLILHPLLSLASVVVFSVFCITVFQTIYENFDKIISSTNKFVRSQLVVEARTFITKNVSDTQKVSLPNLIFFSVAYFGIWMRWISATLNWVWFIISGGLFQDIAQLLWAHPIITTFFIIVWGVFLSSQIFRSALSFLYNQLKNIRQQLFQSDLNQIKIPIPNLVIVICSLHSVMIFLVSSVHWIQTWVYWSTNHYFLSFLLSVGFYLVPKLFGGNEEKLDGMVKVNDVTRMNETIVQRIFMVRTEEDVIHVINLGKKYGKHVSIRGQTHTMGGQTIAPDGFQIDMNYFKRIRWNEKKQTVSVQPGATWGDLIEFLNPMGLSPVTMQSYCSFSIGGTVSVNAHGITTDHPVVRSIVSLRVITSDGKVHKCSRKRNSELFSLVIGGYGLFGVITEIELSTSLNVKISMETIFLKLHEFSKYYEATLKDENVEVKLARIDLTNPENIFLFLYKKTNQLKIVSDLGDGPRKAGIMSRYMFKWLSHIKMVQRVRFIYETFTQSPVDWDGRVDRSLLVYESVKPFSSLLNTIFTLDDTFVLQEYFVPHENLQKWIENIRPELKKNYSHCTLLNITIRYLFQDTETFLPYAKTDMFAFVMYYRIERSADADRELKSIHERLVKITLSLNGTFYLPYRHHYSETEMLKSYPKIPQFFALKTKYDPAGLFSNLWYETYGRKFNPSEPLFPVPTSKLVLPKEDKGKEPEDNLPLVEETVPEPPSLPNTITIPIVSSQRTNSFRKLFYSSSPASSSHIVSEANRILLKRFLQFVFNVERRESVYAIIAHAVQSPANNDDRDIYASIVKSLSQRNFNFVNNGIGFVKSLLQLVDQRNEIVTETVSVLKNLGLANSIKDYASFGDAGKIVAELQRRLGPSGGLVGGKVYVCHDKLRPTDLVERGLFVPHEFVPFDILKVDPGLPIADSSIDLVTMNQGLHHIPQDQLLTFLGLVWRILRPGGIFIFREHDADEDLIPMVDVAHSVFNAVTGVPFEEEANELRAFRTIEGWRKIMTSFGFEDMYQYGLQETDPTLDYMLCFCKPPYAHHKRLTIKFNNGSKKVSEQEQLKQITEHFFQTSGKIRKPLQPTSSIFRFPEWIVVEMAQDFGPSLNHTAFFWYPYIDWLKFYWNSLFSALSVAIEEHGLRATLSSGGFVMNSVIGVFYSLFMVQMAILTLPIRWSTASKDYEPLQLFVQTRTPIQWSQLDRRINYRKVNNQQQLLLLEAQQSTPQQSQAVQSLSSSGPSVHMYFLEIPPHRPFTEILLKMASQEEIEKILEIGGVKSNIAVKMEIYHQKNLSFLENFNGTIVTVHNPPSGSGLHAVVVVPVLRLLEMLRYCIQRETLGTEGVRVIQVYDFFP